MDVQIGFAEISSLAMGIGLSASCGFRVFIPLLAAAIGVKTGFLPVNDTWLWLGSWPSLIILISACIFELLAYYIPFVDNILDAIAAPISIAAGAIIATSLMPLDDYPAMQWGLGILAGGSAAGTIHLGSGFVRLLSSKFTAGTGNFLVSTTENAAAVGGTISAFLLPIFTAIMVIFTIFLILWIAILRVSSKKA